MNDEEYQKIFDSLRYLKIPFNWAISGMAKLTKYKSDQLRQNIVNALDAYDQIDAGFSKSMERLRASKLIEALQKGNLVEVKISGVGVRTEDIIKAYENFSRIEEKLQTVKKLTGGRGLQDIFSHIMK